MKDASHRELLVCQAAVTRELAGAIERIAATDDPVLIEGEPGAGRELVARLIHRASRRRNRALVTVRPGAAPRRLLPDELEGSSNAAFDQARGGTLLVKDVAELSRLAQRKLGRALRRGDDGGVDIRVLATSDPGLERAAERDLFNRALFDRLAVWTLHVPALRERPEDIVPLAGELLRQYGRELGRGRLVLVDRAGDRLREHAWPGNVAELKAVMRRVAVRVKGRSIDRADLDAVLPDPPARGPLAELSLEDVIRAKLAGFLRRCEGYPVSGVHEAILAHVERPLIDLVLEHTGGNQVKAAAILGMNRNTLRRKLTEHGLLGRRRADAPGARGRR